ncbi:MAG: type II toxin-antitoxin system RelE/ParE family toxin [Defluviicoccus sp.]|nr:type II toxin-antitoxin system RelE/ParE family toxin [Defluviicoccus sp.]MDE0276714.1 type II toxin-antitoxin system RelE/ParE family toxin [Defluviicoccus sp.]
MADYRLTLLAEGDLAGIADRTIETLGIEQARRYRDGLEACFGMLADNPRLGRNAESLAPNLRRFEHRSHVVFYVERDDDVVIVRVLHASMDPPRHI